MMKQIKYAFLSLVLALSVPVIADDNHNNDNGHGQGNEHKHCKTNIVTVTVTRTNVVTVTRTNVVTITHNQTNTVTQTLTNYITSSLVDLPVANYPVVANHVYKLLVTSDTSGVWRQWGKIKATDTETIRLILPLDLVKNIYWQLVDTTPGYQKAGVSPVENDDLYHTSYLALTRGTVKKVPTTLPTN